MACRAFGDPGDCIRRQIATRDAMLTKPIKLGRMSKLHPVCKNESRDWSMEGFLPLTWPQYKQRSITDIIATVNSIKSTYTHHCGYLYSWPACVPTVLHALTITCHCSARILATVGSRDSSVGIATGYGLDGWGVGVPVPGGARFFSSPRRPDRLCGPPSLLFNEYRG
jgi:hypothetical protein